MGSFLVESTTSFNLNSEWEASRKETGHWLLFCGTPLGVGTEVAKVGVEFGNSNEAKRERTGWGKHVTC
jgi:hypothetical protein